MPQLDFYTLFNTSLGFSSVVTFIFFGWLFFTVLLVRWKLLLSFSAKGYIAGGLAYFQARLLPAQAFSADLLEQFVFASSSIVFEQYMIGVVFALAALFYFSGLFFVAVIKFVAATIRDLMQDLARHFLRALLFFSSIALVVFICNLTGVLPLSFTITSSFSAPFFLALGVFFTCLFTIISKYGSKLGGGLLPQGTNPAIANLIVIIEFISNLAKFVSLAVRLFANMFAGHLLLKVFYIIAYNCVFSAADGLFSLSGNSALFIVLFVSLLEFMIASLQAFVFLLLVALYIREMELFVAGH